MAKTNPEYMSEPYPPEFPIIPGDRSNNAGGIIIQGNKCAVRTECAKNSTLCPQKGGPICWDQIMVTDDHGEPTSYNWRTVYCGKSEKGQEILDAIFEEIPVFRNPFPRYRRR